VANTMVGSKDFCCNQNAAGLPLRQAR